MISNNTANGLNGQVFAVTGGASGIGLSIVSALCERGASVAILDLPNSQGALVATRLQEEGKHVQFFDANVSELERLDDVAAEVEKQLGPISGFVANAGISRVCAAMDYTPEAWRETMGVNLDGAFFSVQAFARRMRAHGGSIVMISSIAAKHVVSPETHAAYGASKAAVAHLASLLGIEWASLGIRVNAVAPGYTDTPILQKMKTDDPSTVAAWVNRTHLGRLLDPQEIANSVVFLLSGYSSGITGTVLEVDAGYR
ncbi:SDR family NAD(P)-dependent oxidoreductase [Pseudomonas pudica]|uniref:SDR family oxidoreductase n=1 Tax=Pseudomonas pudica TaxID=272772 RepID=A0ABS0FUG8_9PSED|nr:SDR family oxidoreductase [Pseudomonas pudica]MBF8644011.1 SDR family oxidoreductase [Pseudomonas pudica]MBF8758622.1 SDR family oxidoreductase [Pseudomonas pudica]